MSLRARNGRGNPHASKQGKYGLLRRFTPRNDEGSLTFAMTGGARLLAMTGLVLLFVHDGIDA